MVERPLRRSCVYQASLYGGSDHIRAFASLIEVLTAFASEDEVMLHLSRFRFGLASFPA
jgi:hypothetical protein